MLDFIVSQYPFRFGLAEGTEPHQASPGTLLTAENCVWRKSGKLEKRSGNTSLSRSILGGGTLSAASRIFVRGSELCLIDGTSLYAYTGATSPWRTIGPVANVGLTWATQLDSATGVKATCIAKTGNFLVQAWIGGDPTTGLAGPLYADVIDATTKSRLMPVAVVSAASTTDTVRCLVLAGVPIIIAKAGANITATTIDTAGLVVNATVNLRTDSRVNGAGCDACIIGSTLVISYELSTGGLKLYSYTLSGFTLTQAATGGITGEAGTIIGPISIDGAAGEVLYVGYSVASTLKTRIAIADASTLVQSVAPADVDATTNATYVAVARYDATRCVFLDAVTGCRTRLISSAGSIDANTRRGTRDTRPLSRPFMVSGRCYVWMSDGYNNGASQSQFSGTNSILAEVETSTVGALGADVPHRHLGMVDMLIGGTAKPGLCSNVVVASSTDVWCALPFLGEVPSSYSNWRQGLRLASATFGTSLPVDMWRASYCGGEGYVSGGVLSAYDGRSLFDYGFTRAPIIDTKSTLAGSVLAGTYLYSFVQEQRSFAGLLHRSPATPPLTVVLASNLDVTLALRGVSVGNKQTISTFFGANNASPTSIPIFRSTLGGSVLQRLSYEPTYNTLVCDPTAVNTIVDNRPDANIGGGLAALSVRPVLYTTGGILDDYQPPAGVTMCLHADRLWVLAGDLKTWWYSKAFQDDLGVAPGFHPSLRISFADTQTAMASMDDKAIFFSATGVKYMLGTGPAPSGLSSDFQTPTTIQSDVGCTNARSVVATPDGIMFLSARGLYLLDRGMTLSWIGRPVKDTLAAFPNVTSAVLVAKQNQVRFTCNNAAGTAGCTIVYDYVERQWSTFRHSQGAGTGGAPGLAYADACMWNGAWTFVTATGLVYVESTTSYLDDGTYVPMTLETAWITPPPSAASPSQGPLAFQSVRAFQLHGVSSTDHDLTIQVGFDSEVAYAQSITFPATGVVTAVGTPEDCEVTIGTRRKCGAIRFKINDASPSAGTIGTGQGPSFDMMGLELGSKRGLGNTPATRKG